MCVDDVSHTTVTCAHHEKNVRLCHACEVCCLQVMQCFSSQVFFCHASHAHRVRCWCWSAAVCSTGRGRQSPVAPFTGGTTVAPIATCPRSSTPWTAVSKSWGQFHQRGGDVGNRCSSRCPQHVALQEDIASVATEPSGDKPSAADDGIGDGAGDDEPFELCTKGRKTHIPLEVLERVCFLHPRITLCRPPSLEPAADLDLADILVVRWQNSFLICSSPSGAARLHYVMCAFGAKEINFLAPQSYQGFLCTLRELSYTIVNESNWEDASYPRSSQSTVPVVR